MAPRSAATNDEGPTFSDDLPTLTKPEAKTFGLALGATILFSATATVIILLLLFEKMPRRQVSTRPFCCPEVLDEISKAANMTVDPCKDIYRHTCFAHTLVTTEPAFRHFTPAFRQLPTEVYARDSFSKAASLHSDPVRGFPTTMPGRVIASFYQACALAPSSNSSVGQDAAEAILKFTSITSPMSPERLLELVLDLSLKYGLPSVLRVQLASSDADSLFSVLNVMLSSFCRLQNFYTPWGLLQLKEDVLSTINDALSSTITFEEVETSFERFDNCSAYEKFLNRTRSRRNTNRSSEPRRRNRTVTRRPETIKEANSTLDYLVTLTTHITAAQWRQVLGKFLNYDSTSVVSRVPLRVLASVLEDFLDPKNQPLTTVMALVSSSMHLASRLFFHTKDRDGWMRFCELRASELRPLWVQDKLGSLPVQSQDNAIRQTYLYTLNVVQRKVAAFVTPADLGGLTDVLFSMRLLLPSDIAPENDTLPTMGANFAQAYLEGQKYLFRIRMYHIRTLGVGLDFAKDVEKDSIAVRGKTLTIPIRVYSLLTFGKDVDRLVTMPTVGVLLASSIWNVVFSADWSRSAREPLRVYRTCLEDSLRHVRQWSFLKIPYELSWLGLESGVEASRDDYWNHPVDDTQRWNLTRSRAFYMIFVTYNSCKSVASGMSPLYFLDVNGLLKYIPDYIATYQCNDTSSSLQTSQCSSGISLGA